jgi:hypothetical protein
MKKGSTFEESPIRDRETFERFKADRERNPALAMAYDDVWYARENMGTQTKEFAQAHLRLLELIHEDRINTGYYDTAEEILREEEAIEEYRQDNIDLLT